MRLELQRQKVEMGEIKQDKENEKEVSQIQEQIDRRLKELEGIRAENEIFKKQLELVKTQKLKNTEVNTASLMKAAMSMTPAGLQYIYYQMYMILSKRMKVYPQANYTS